MPSKVNSEGLKQLVLNNSENSLNDKVREGRLGIDEHAMGIETIKASRLEWNKAKAYLENQRNLGFLDDTELPICLAVCSEICPSRFD